MSLEIQGNSGNTSVQCSTDSTLGQSTIPAAVLGLLDAGTMLLPMTVGKASSVSDGFETVLYGVMGMYTPDRTRIDFELE